MAETVFDTFSCSVKLVMTFSYDRDKSTKVTQCTVSMVSTGLSKKLAATAVCYQFQTSDGTKKMWQKYRGATFMDVFVVIRFDETGLRKPKYQKCHIEKLIKFISYQCEI